MTTRLVGREADLASIERALAADRPVVLLGEAGIGKTSLVEEVLRRDGRPVRRGGGLATLSWMPFLAVARALGRTSFDVDEPAAAADLVEREVGADILFVDDLHACDPGSLQVVAALASRSTVVAAIRLGDAGTARAREAIRGAGFHEVELAPLSAEECRAVARGVRPGIAVDELERVVHRSGGLPLLVEELASGADESTLVRSLRARLSFLDEQARSSALLLAVSGRPLPDGLPGADALVEARVAVRPAEGLLAVRHALLAGALVEGAESDEVRACHVRLAELSDDPAVRAHHLVEAGEHHGARAAALEAVHAAESPGGRADALLLAARAAGLDDGVGEQDVVLMVDAAAQLVAVGRAHEASQVLGRVESLPVEDASLAGRAAALRAQAAWMDADMEAFERALAECRALEPATPPEVRVDLLYQRATHAILVANDQDAARDVCAEHLRVAQEAGRGLARALMRMATLELLVGDPEGLERMKEAQEQARREGDLACELPAANNIMDGLQTVGRVRESFELALEQAERARQLGLADWQRQFQAMAAVAAMYLGEHGETLRLCDEVEAVARDPRTALQVRGVRLVALLELGGAAEVLALTPGLRADVGDAAPEATATCAYVDAAALWHLGRLEEAERAARSADLDLRSEYPELAHSILDWVVFEQGGVPDPIADDSVRSALVHRLRAENDGVRHLAHGDADAAARLFDEAAEQWAPRWRYAELRCRWAAAESRRRAGAPRDEVVDELLALEAAAAGHRFAWILQRVQRSLRLAGVVRASERTIDRSSLLTSREAEILRLAADGMSDPEIARRLALGVPTVRRHVGNAVLKLGVPTRTAAVAAVVRA